MSKIFRLHTDGTQDVQHWSEMHSHFHDGMIDKITDPSNATAQTQLTSIPSPFARLDLVKTAFRHIINRQELDANTIYHKIVSEALDIAQLFFNYDSLKDKLEILEWRSGVNNKGGEVQVEKDSELGTLINSSNPKHRLTGNTLKMFLSQDSQDFNFMDLQSIFLLNYRLGPDSLNILGGTSPSSLFFSSANDLSYVDISFGNHKILSHQFLPLYQRDEAFILYIFRLRDAFRQANGDSGDLKFADKFPDFNNYLNMNYSRLPVSIKAQLLATADSTFYEKYSPIPVGAENNHAEINGFVLRGQNTQEMLQNSVEDFKIAATKPGNNNTPLILPIDPFSDEMRYAGGVWQRNYYQQVPFSDDRPLNERTLPNFSHVKKPYMTISDLLQPFIVRLPFPIDDQSFFSGGYQEGSGKAEQGFALPLKKQILEYFTLEDLTGHLPDGKRMFELSALPGGIKATLRVPVGRNKYVTLSRLYHLGNLQAADEKTNTGVISDHQFTLGIYPFMHTPAKEPAHYRVMLAERDYHPLHRQSDCQLKFYRQSQPSVSLSTVIKERSDKKTADQVGSCYYILGSSFDFMEVTHHTSNNLLIPIFPAVHPSAKAFKFAVDFGTTNTHIEYQVNGEEPRAFDLPDDKHLKTLHNPQLTPEFFNINAKNLGLTVDQLTRVLREEFIPATLGEGSDFHFPQRTVIYDNGNFNPDEANYALADFNIPFWYLKETLNLKQGSSRDITPNLKWSNFQNDPKMERRTRAFLKQVMLMLRNKVLTSGGQIDATSVVVFYPNSMPWFRRRFLQAAWETYFQRYFPGANKLFHLSESFAPFQYFKRNLGVQAMDRPVVCVDIGGGTSDIVIYSENQPQLLTSFQFASNALFGDGYGNTSANNGFVQKYEQIIRQMLSGTSATNLNEVYNSIKTKHSSSIELIEFFFSLQENKLIRDANMQLNFSKLLSEDPDMRITILFYYSAIIYHIARLMKKKNMLLPRYLTFSGNGSKVVSMLSSGSKDITLQKFTKVIFEDVYGIPYEGELELKLLDNPKEATCKGGLLVNDYASLNNVETDIREVLIGGLDDQLISEEQISYQQLNDPQLIDAVHDGVADFIDRFFSWNDQFNYYNNFGISPRHFDDYRTVLKGDLKNFLKTGVSERQQQTNDNMAIALEETLFFYPLTGALNKLAYHIYKQNA